MPRYSDYARQHLRFTNDMRPDWSSEQVTALCPFHHDTHPSFRMNLRTGMYICLACGVKGGINSLSRQLAAEAHDSTTMIDLVRNAQALNAQEDGVNGYTLSWLHQFRVGDYAEYWLGRGFITDNVGWHWIFYVNVPLGLAILWFGWRYLRPDEDHSARQRPPFDVAGVGLFAGSKDNVAWYAKRMSIRTIGGDKLNQLRHLRLLQQTPVDALMDRHRAIIAPKFEKVLEIFSRELHGVARWTTPKSNTTCAPSSPMTARAAPRARAWALRCWRRSTATTRPLWWACP